MAQGRKRGTPRSGGPPGFVRIIGGTHRGRRLVLVPDTDTRPTPDRVRETLFNWLMPALPGAHCLDLFAGTGALGLEALSRGAGESWFVERDPRVAAAIESALLALGGRGQVVRADARRWLAAPAPRTFDLVFLDPPFAADGLAKLCTLLDRGWLSARAWVYLETRRTNALPDLPEGWRLHRESEAGEVRFALARLGLGD
jgi:16S rRNA (guanine966-N2)-methyltransferase